LLVGGVLSGQSLIRAAELRSIPQQATRYETAALSFRDKYFSYPGDMSNAVRFWGAQAGATTDGIDATCAALTNPATGTATCNGNGDGQWGNGWPIVAHEQYRAWQHLANAGLIEGSYAGVGIPTSEPVIGRNVPATRMSNIGVEFFYIPAGAAANTYYYPSIANTVALLFGKGATTTLTGGAFKPEDQWNIDTKFDDGKPGTGKIFASGAVPACAGPANSPSATYVLTTTSEVCNVYWRLVN
jgi:hypothetical protein